MKIHFPKIIIALIINNTILISKALSQLIMNDNVAITVQPGTQLTLQGDIRNENAASISNSGIIDLSGNWINNAGNDCFGTSQGTVILNGVNQSIGGSSSTVFNNLMLQGSGTKTLLINTTVGGGNGTPSGILNVGNVQFDLNSRSLAITNSSGGAVTYGTGYILSEDADNSSKVTWDINTAAGVHTIPFGNTAGVQIPFSFNLTSGNAGIVSVSTYATAADNTPFPVAPVPVTHVRNIFGLDNSANTVDRFWQVDPSGTPVATLTFTYAASENAVNGNTNLRAQRWNPSSTGWDVAVAGQSMPTTQSVLVPGANTWGPYALALDNSPLPVELLDFNAVAVNNKQVLCTWSTASEINNDFFTVERSADGKIFEEAGRVKGAGNSTSVLHYGFTDEHPYKGISYYRLKQTDFDGQYSYSEIVAVNLTKNTSLFVSVFPNPSSGNITLMINSDREKDFVLRSMNAGGQLISSEPVHAEEGFNKINLDKTHLPKGIYFMLLAGENENITVKMVIE